MDKYKILLEANAISMKLNKNVSNFIINNLFMN